MENKIFSKFNIYDQIGYLMVGAIALIIFAFDAVYFFKASVPLFNLNTFLIWFVIAYFLGHLIQGIANLIGDIEIRKKKPLQFLIPEEKRHFDEAQREILQQARNYFKLQNTNESKLWNLCYMFATAKDITKQVQSFNSYYSLYRGWLVIFVLESLFLLYFLIVKHNWQMLFWFLGSIFLAFIFYRRSRRFWEYTKDKVLETFIIVKNLNL